MLNIKKLLKVLLCGCMLFCTITIKPIKIKAKENQIIEILKCYYPEGNENVIVSFIDDEITNKINDTITSKGAVIEKKEYSHSFYQFNNYSITQYDYGSIFNQISLIPVSKGSEKKLSKSVTTSTTVGFTGSVDSKIKQVINVKFTGNVSGTFSHTWTTDVIYKGPSESSSYDYYTYYGGLRYDLATCYLYKYDVYNIYYNGVYSHSTQTKSQISITGVKIPKVVEYRVGGNV